MSLGKKMSSLLGRSFKTSKFKMLAKLTIVRIAILRKNHQSRCSQAMADVVSLLKSGQQQDALLRVQHLIKEQNVLDVFHIIESHCNVVKEKIKIINKSKDCPEELKEAIHTLIYAASRCGGEFRELQDMRVGFTKWFGKDFADDAVELRKNSQVNLSIIPKLSARQLSLETRKTVLRQIAYQNGIALHLDEEVISDTEQQLIKDNMMEQNEDLKVEDLPDLPGQVLDVDDLLEAIKPSEEYQDAAAAAQDAYESAAYAAIAARAAVQLSRSEAQLQEDQISPDTQKTIPT
ncbi:unnamed protein product [Rhodiola kirilowii]